EGHPFHELHGEAPAGVLDEQLVKLDQVGMIYVSKRSELLLEAIDRPGVDSLQSLERNALAAQTIEHDEHRPEASPVQAMRHLEAGGLCRCRLGVIHASLRAYPLPVSSIQSPHASSAPLPG